MILAGDIGGTKTVMALYEDTGVGIQLKNEEVYSSQDNPTFEGILNHFLDTHGRPAIDVGCFGVAGAVINGRVETTNLPWVLREEELAKFLGARCVPLLNDLEAAAFGMLFLESHEMEVLAHGAASPSREGNIAVIAAGTGLGEAMLFWDGSQHHPIASEGGHCDFGPRTDEEIELLRYLRTKFDGHVSYERILSGNGFYNLYSFLRDTGAAPESPVVAEALTSGDPNAVVTQFGLKEEDALCQAALELFCTIYGAEAGNLVLKCMAIGGVYIGGGIAPKILPALKKKHFLDGFTDKGRFSELTGKLRVSVALNPRAPLIGAAHYAQRAGSAG